MRNGEPRFKHAFFCFVFFDDKWVSEMFSLKFLRTSLKCPLVHGEVVGEVGAASKERGVGAASKEVGLVSHFHKIDSTIEIVHLQLGDEIS